MQTDLASINTSSKMYTYALNASITDMTGDEFLIQNTHSNISKATFPKDFKVIGRTNIYEKNKVLYFLVNPLTGLSQIGEIDNIQFSDSTDEEFDCVNGDCREVYNKELTPLEQTKQVAFAQYKTIIESDCLKFNIDYPIDIEYRITDCGINVYFTDNLNQRRFIYLEYNQDGSLKIQQTFYKIIGTDPNNCNLPIYSNELDCNKILYNPCFSKPCIDFVDITPGGSLKAGVYQFLISYSDKSGNPLTNYFPATQPIPVFNKYTTVVTNYQTDQAITLKINNIENQTFLYYNLVVAETIDSFTEFKHVGTFPVSYSTVDNYTYTGNDESLVKLTAIDVLFRRPYYSTAKSITKSNNYLFFGGLKEYKQLNLQRAANKVKVYWQTIAMPESVYSKARNSFHFRTFQRDEIYSLGIIFESCDGWETCAFTIPGNSAEYYKESYNINVYDIIPSTNPDVITDNSCADNDINRRWQVYNTAQKIPGMCEYKFTENCDEANVWEAGDFGYHESTELYPNDPLIWGDLCGKPIRHHRFPDSYITHIHDSQCGSKHFEDNSILFPIGIRVDNTSVINALNQAVLDGLITQEDRNKLIGYRIVRGNRQGNKTIVAKGLLYDMWSYVKDNKVYHYANYPYNDISPDNFIANTKTTYDQDSLKQLSIPNYKPVIPNIHLPLGRYTFHSPDTHFTNPTLGSILKLETVEYGESEGYFNEAQEQSKYKRMTFFARLIALGMGVAAALSATEEKECVTYTIKSDYKFKQEKFEVDSNGKAPYGNVSGTLTLGTGAISTSEASGSWNGTAKVPEIKATQDNTVCLAQNTFNKKTGLKQDGDPNKIMTAASDSVKQCKDLDNENVVEQYTRTTCTGTPHQLLSTSTDVPIMNTLNGILNTLIGNGPQIIQQVLLGMKEMEIVLDLIRSLIPEKNYAIQYNSVGVYNNYVCVPNNLGIKNRKITRGAYLAPIHQTISDNATSTTFSTSTVNNWNRESSVYLNTFSSGTSSLLYPHQINTTCVKKDNSRVTMGDDGMKFSYDDLNKRFKRNIASYYASIKNFVPDQYGKIYNIEYLETNGCTFNFDKVIDSNKYVVFGGDTFINKFALKRKMPFFTQTRFKQLNGADVEYSKLGNVGYPNYYFDSQKALFDRLSTSNIFTSLLNPLTLIDEIVGLEDARLDARKMQLFYQKGYIHLYNYGIPYFFVESDVNVDYRYGQNNLEKDFYPHNTDLDNWLQEKNVPIKEDNYYFYNKTYSKQNKENIICNNNVNFEPNKECIINHPNRIIYSDIQDNATNNFDNWRVFKANSYYDFPLSDGKLITADGIESDKVLVRLENMSRVFAAYNTIPTDAENIQVETGGLFKSRPKEFVVADLGYAGTQHRDILHTEFGHIWVDAKRGNVFNLSNGASGLDELGKDGMKNWFKENLPFKILKSFTNFQQDDIDNNFKGIGISLCYDRRYHRIFITKKDYKKINKDVLYNDITKTFYVLNGATPITVSLTDTKYFCDASWTISYNFQTKSWVSFHSFKPLYYNYFIDNFESGIDGSVWSHGVTNKSYQVYYGKLYPFTFEYLTNQSVSINLINSIEYVLDTVRYHNEFDYFYNRNINFNEAIIYNEHQSTGLLELVVRNENDLSQVGVYPKYMQDRIKILTTNSENIWRVNSFYDLVKSQTNNVPLFLNSCANDSKFINNTNINYYISDLNKARMRSKQCRIRLTNSIYSNYSFKFNFAQTNQIKSYR